MNLEPKVNVKFNLYGINRNTNESSLLNTFKHRFYVKDSIEQVKRTLCLDLFNKLENDENLCKYCFNKTKKSKPSKIKTPTPSIEITPEKKEDNEELNQDLDDEELEREEDRLESEEEINPEIEEESDKEEDIFFDENEFGDEEDFATWAASQLDSQQYGGGKKEINRCTVCNKEYSDDLGIFPFPSLFYFWNNKKNDNYEKTSIEQPNEGYQIGHSFRHKKVKMEYINMNLDINKHKYNYYNPYELITGFIDNKKFEVMRKDFKSTSTFYKEFIRNVRGTRFFQLLKYNFDANKSPENKHKDYISVLKNDHLLLLSDYYNFKKNDEIVINIAYFPEFCYLAEQYNNGYSEDLIYNLYWPFMDFDKYYNLNYKRKNISSNNEYLLDKTILKWNKETEYYDNIIDNMNKVEKWSGSFISTTRIYLTLNDTESTIQYINFSNIYHSFQLDSDVPYLSTYIPEEGMFLERMYEPLKHLPDKENWNLIKKDMMRFHVKLPFTYKDPKQKRVRDIYCHVNLFENMKIDVNIPIVAIAKINITQDKLDMIIEKHIKKLITRLNDVEGGIFSNTISNIELKINTLKMNGMNFIVEIPLAFGQEDFINTIDKLQKCLYPFFYEDYKEMENIEGKKTFRYKRFNSYKTGNEIDKFLYIKLKDYEEIHRKKTRDKMEGLSSEQFEILINTVMNKFNITHTESLFLVNRYQLIYFKKLQSKPVVGTYFHFTLIENDLTKKKSIRASIRGVRDYEEMNNMHSFIHRLLSLLFHLNYQHKTKSKPFTSALNFFKNNSLCGIKNKDKKEAEDFQEEKLIEKGIVMDAKKLLSCEWSINEYEKKIKKLKKSKKDKKTKKIDKYKKKLKQLNKIKTKLKKKKSKSSQLNKTILKSSFPHLKEKETEFKTQNLHQPMGTGRNNPPHKFVEFNWQREKRRFDNWPTCEDELVQEGGGGDISQLTKKYYEEAYLIYPSDKYVSRRDINACDKGPGDGGYMVKDLRKMLYDLGYNKTELNKKLEEKYGDSKKESLCKFIKNEIKKNSGEKVIDKKFNQIGNDLKLQGNENKIKKQFKIRKSNSAKDFLLNNLSNKDIEENYKNFIILFNIEKGSKVLEKLGKSKSERKKIMINRIRYQIYKMNEWTNDDLDIFYISLYPNEDKPDDNKLIKMIIESDFKEFASKFLISESREVIVKTKLKQKYLHNFWDKMERGGPDKKGILVVNDGNDEGIIKQTTLNFFGKAITCPNYIESDAVLAHYPNKLRSLNIDEYNDKPELVRKLICHPICHKFKKTKEELQDSKKLGYLFCGGEIDYRTYRTLLTKIGDNENENYVSTKAINDPGTLGKLPDKLHKIFNYFNIYLDNVKGEKVPQIFFKTKRNEGRKLTSPGFILLGARQGKKNVLDAMGVILNLNREEIKSKIIKFIKGDKFLFNSLNQGILSFRFKKSIINFLNYIDKDYQQNDIEWLLDLFSRPGLFHKKGFNIIVFKLNEDKNLVINPPSHLFINDYYNPKKPNIYLYKYDDNYIEPIVLKFPNVTDVIGIFDGYNSDNFVKRTKLLTSQQYLLYIDNLNNFLGDWYKATYSKKGSFPLLTAKQTLKVLDPDNSNKKIKQLVDSFHKVIYILDENKNLIPVKPSGYVHERGIKGIKYFAGESEVLKYKKSFEETVIYLKNFIKKIIPKEIRIKIEKKKKLNINEIEKQDLLNMYSITFLILNKDNKEEIIGVELPNYITIPIIPITNKKIMKKYEKSKYFLEFDINEALFKKSIPKLNKKIVQDEYNKETYNRFLVEISHYLSEHKKIQERVIYFIKKINGLKAQKFNNKNQNKRIKLEKKLYQLVSFIFYKISIADKDLIKNITQKDLKNDKIIHTNRRRACSLYKNDKEVCNNDTYCTFDSGKCKIHIPLEKVNTIIGNIIEEFIGNTQNAKNILGNNVDTIVDRFLFDEKSSVNNMIYRRKQAKFDKIKLK